MITFERVIEIAKNTPQEVETVRFPILRIKQDTAVYWGDSEATKHNDMLKELGVTADIVGCAQRVSIYPKRKGFTINPAGSSIMEDGYELDPNESLLVEAYLTQVFGAVADGAFSLWR